MAVDLPWATALMEQFMFRDALASVSLSHKQGCDCDVCKAASGDDDAFARLYAASKERRDAS